MLKTCEGWESNPHTEVPDPKSGASANSATLAILHPKIQKPKDIRSLNIYFMPRCKR